MERIILIETSTALCSVALAEDGTVTAYRESSAPKAHASLTAVFVQEVLAERGVTFADCDAVCVCMGPGSYTGLRVGVSTAKGLCFGAGKPLLAVGTLDTLVAQASSPAEAEANVEPRSGLYPRAAPSIEGNCLAGCKKTSRRIEGIRESPPPPIPCIYNRFILYQILHSKLAGLQHRVSQLAKTGAVWFCSKAVLRFTRKALHHYGVH